MEKYTGRRTASNIARKILEAKDMEELTYYEDIMISVYASSLLVLAGIANFLVRYFILESDPVTVIVDSLLFFLLAFAFDVITRLDLKNHIVTIISTILSSLTIVMLTVRLYEVIGPAVLTAAVIQLIISLTRISKKVSAIILLTIILANIYIFWQSFNAPPYQPNIVYYIVQIVLFCLLSNITAIVHMISVNRYEIINNKMAELNAMNEAISQLNLELKASEAELKGTLENLAKTQDYLIQQEKLAGIGHLAAGVAHEINNPLGYIICNFDTVREYTKRYQDMMDVYQRFIDYLPEITPDMLEAKIAEVKKIHASNDFQYLAYDLKELFNDNDFGLKQIKEIVMGLKTFSQVDQNDSFEAYDLNQGIKNTLNVIGNEITPYVKVIGLYGDIPLIQAKANQINKVLLNIIMNALYAVKMKQTEYLGTLYITTDVITDCVRCQIEDNGIGIEEEHIKNIFNPFFTTKPVGQGTGLGLSMAYDIVVTGHGGTITAESTLGTGTKLTILLPVFNSGQPEHSTV